MLSGSREPTGRDPRELARQSPTVAELKIADSAAPPGAVKTVYGASPNYFLRTNRHIAPPFRTAGGHASLPLPVSRCARFEHAKC